MTKNPFKFIYHLFLYMLYRHQKLCEYNLYLLAQDKGMFCKNWDIYTGIAEFNPNRPPQDRPKKSIGFKEAMTKFNKGSKNDKV